MKRLRGYARAVWARQIDGVSVSLWITPSWKYAYLYENGTRHVAKDAEEQAEIHRTLGLPDVEGDFETGLRQQVAGVGQPAPRRRDKPMTIDGNCGIYSLTCDICGEDADEDFFEFYDAVNYKKANGWKSQKRDGEWEDVCPVCQEAGES